MEHLPLVLPVVCSTASEQVLAATLPKTTAKPRLAVVAVGRAALLIPVVRFGGVMAGLIASVMATAAPTTSLLSIVPLQVQTVSL